MKKMIQKHIAFLGITAMLLPCMTVPMPVSAVESTVPDTIMAKTEIFDYEQSVPRYTNKTKDSYLIFSGAAASEVGRFGEYNYWTSANDYKIQQGLVENTLDANGKAVLTKKRTTPSATSGKLFQSEESKGTFQMPLKYNSETKFYEYDSARNNLLANSATGVMEYAPKMNDGFFPLGEGNFWFGMETTLPFVYRNNGVANDGSDMEFRFSGDDDVWVFVDGKLALDLGGIHNAVSGSINFHTGVITTIGKINSRDANNTEHYSNLEDLGFDFSAEEHTLKIFYLERGAGKANCKMALNVIQPTNYMVKYYDGALYDGTTGDDTGLIASTVVSTLNGKSVYVGDQVKVSDVMIDINDATHALAVSDQYYGGFVVDDNFQPKTDPNAIAAVVTDADTDIIRVIFLPKPSYTITYWYADNKNTPQSEWKVITQSVKQGHVGDVIKKEDIVTDLNCKGEHYQNGIIVNKDSEGVLGILSAKEALYISVVYYGTEPEEADESIHLKDAKHAYIFGYEPIINVTRDKKGHVISREVVLNMAMDEAVTREQVSAMLTRMIDQTYSTQNVKYPLTDNIAAYEGTWYVRGLAYMASMGAFDGIEKVDVGPVTRGEVAKLFACGLKLSKTTDTAYTDIENSIYAPYIKKMAAYGYMTGTGATTFEPDKIMTRAELCSLFNNIIGRNKKGLIALDKNGKEYQVTAETYYFSDMNDTNHWAYEICLKATSAYTDDGYVDVEARNANIRNVLDQFDAQTEY